MYTILYVSWCILVAYIPSEAITEWQEWCMLSFCRYWKPVFHSWYTNLYFYQQYVKSLELFFHIQGFIITSHYGFHLHFSEKFIGVLNIFLRKYLLNIIFFFAKLRVISLLILRSSLFYTWVFCLIYVLQYLLPLFHQPLYSLIGMFWWLLPYFI